MRGVVVLAAIGCALGLSVGCGESRFFASIPLEAGTLGPTATGGDAGTASGDGDGSEQTSGSGGAGVVGFGGALPSAGRSPRPTLRVSGTQLLGRCDENVLLRGANEMVIWSSERDGQPWFDEMSKLGANSVRIVWLAEGSAVELDRVIKNATSAGLVPVVEMHRMQFEGENFEAWDPELPGLVLDYWTSPDILEVIVRHEQSLILEVCQELGNFDDVADWVSRYGDVLARMRQAGFRGPIALDAPFGGNRVDDFIAGAPLVLAADPIRNTMFSVEGWSGTVDDVSGRMRAFADAGIPFYMGEFSGYLGGECPDSPGDLSVLLATMQELGVGWFGWSWGGVQNSGCEALDITAEGLVDELTLGGQQMALTDPNSIANTSVRVTSLDVDQCPD